MNKVNYQKKLDEIINGLGDTIPRLLLHSCCAPCSSYVIEYLSKYFEITVFFYNPNIYPDEEFKKRADEEKRFINAFDAKNKVSFIEGNFDTEKFYSKTQGFEYEPEGGKRCERCFELRLEETARKAEELQMDFFCTTLTISPLKNAQALNDIGEAMAKKYEVAFLPSDFKKKEGYKRSIELSDKFQLYRQNYCGCIFSQRDGL